MATLEEVLEAGSAEGHDEEALEAYYDNNSHYYAGEDVEDILSSFGDAYQGEYGSGEDYAEEIYASMGANLGDLAHYIDWGRVWHDMECEGTWTAFTGRGAVHVFICV